MFRTIALTGIAALVAAATISLAPPARAQIGNIFSDPAPRPPGAIPRGSRGSSRRNSTTTTSRCRNCRGAACCRHPIVRRRGRACRRRGRCRPSRWRRRPAPPSFRKIPRPALPSHRRSPVRVSRRRRRSAAGTAPEPKGGATCRRRRPACSPATRWSPSRRRRRSSTRRRAFPGSTRSPGASSISTRISARPSSSARCG